jgi:murein DD-endopeptidase MepM/ murein hydrolase activator NlpD
MLKKVFFQIALFLLIFCIGCASYQQRAEQDSSTRSIASVSTELPEAYFSKQRHKRKDAEHELLYQSIFNKMNRDMIWPLKEITITSSYGRRKKVFHDGVDLRAKVGTPVYAALDGVVVYAGNRINGYGRMLILRHKNDFSTLYAHNQKILVKKGEYVLQGQKIAFSGSTGRCMGPHLHFEVRYGVHPIDPVKIAVGRPDLFRLDFKSQPIRAFSEKKPPSLMKKAALSSRRKQKKS